MGTALDQHAAFVAHVASQKPTAPIRRRLTDAEAVALIAEHGTESLRHPAQAAEGLKLLQASLAETQPIGDALIAYVERRKEAAAKFWDAVAGEEIGGAEIVRRAP
jgi:acyl transferase domain-containing protein